MVIEVISKYEGCIQNEALSALNAIVREFQAHSINLFEAMLPTDRRTRFVLLSLYCKNLNFNKILNSYFISE